MTRYPITGSVWCKRRAPFRDHYHERKTGRKEGRL